MMTNPWKEAEARKAASVAACQAACQKMVEEKKFMDKTMSELSDMIKLVRAVKLGEASPISERPKPILKPR